MYERFTDRARKVMQLANQEAIRFNHEYIGTEHLLLGLIREGSGVAANVLKNLDIDLRRIRTEVEHIVQMGPAWPTDRIPVGALLQTPRAKKIIEYAIEEAGSLHHNYVGTEHLLLGMLRENEGVAAQILMYLGLTVNSIREGVLELLGHDVRGETSVSAEFTRSNIKNLDISAMFERATRAVDLKILDIPEVIEEATRAVNVRIAEWRQQKEAAVDEQDWERAAQAYHEQVQLQNQQRKIIRNWFDSLQVDLAWLAWNDGTVLKLVEMITRERQWSNLPILADALEEAGCTNQTILNHCRRPGEHGDRCWVVDLLLERAEEQERPRK